MVKGIAVAPDGQSLLSESLDGTIRLWEMPTGCLRRVWIDESPFWSDNAGWLRTNWNRQSDFLGELSSLKECSSATV